RLRDRAPRRGRRALLGAGDAGRRAVGARGRGHVRGARGMSDPTFEEAERELEAIVERLERGDAGVEELTRLWERGEELYRICATKLENVRGRIEELARSTEQP